MPTNRIVTLEGATFNFTSIHGVVDTPGEQLKVIEKPGTSGFALKSMGWKAEPTPLFLTAFTVDAASARTFELGIKALQGKSVTLWDGHGDYKYPVAILRSKVDRKRKTVWFKEGALTYLGAYRFEISMTALFTAGSVS